MNHSRTTQVGKHWVALALMAVTLGLSLAPLAEASSYQYGSNYQYYNNNSGSYPYTYGYNYNNYQYPHINYYPQRYTQKPTCTITISPTTAHQNSYQWGYPMLLTWSANYADTASISPSVGSVTPNGSRIVYSKGEQYAMSVYGAGGTATCYTTSYTIPFYGYGSTNPYNYNYSNYYTPTYTYPTYTYAQPATTVNNYVVGSTASVSLKQIPYTGAGFGVIGDAMAWFALILVAAFGAGMIAYSKRREWTAMLAKMRA